MFVDQKSSRAYTYRFFYVIASGTLRNLTEITAGLFFSPRRWVLEKSRVKRIVPLCLRSCLLRVGYEEIKLLLAYHGR